MALSYLSFVTGASGGAIAMGALAKLVGYPAMFRTAGALTALAALALAADPVLQSRLWRDT
jgi:hypothetical protein